MPITPEDYNSDAIKGEKLERLANLVVQKLVDNGMVSAESLAELERRLSSVEQHLADTNIGDRVADSLDAQSLKVGGNDVADSLSGKADKTDVVSALASKVTGPSSATADDIAVFDGDTGKLVKDGGKKLSDLITTKDLATTDKAGIVQFMTTTEATAIWDRAWLAATPS